MVHDRPKRGVFLLRELRCRHGAQLRDGGITHDRGRSPKTRDDPCAEPDSGGVEDEDVGHIGRALGALAENDLSDSDPTEDDGTGDRRDEKPSGPDPFDVLAGKDDQEFPQHDDAG